MSKRTTKQSERAQWLEMFYAQECCGKPMQSGYDVMTYECRHSDYQQVTENAAYIMCSVCGTTETLCSECITEAVKDARN